VLLGDYQMLVPRADKSYALGGPLVHIRAIPEGGPAGAITASSLPYTFYDLYTAALPARTADRRQPLPSTFAARFIQGGTGAFNTAFKIWREGVTAGSCTTGTNGVSRNSYLTFAEIVRFDEHENATVTNSDSFLSAAVPPPGTAATMMLPSRSSYFPPSSTSGDVAGWIYMNLNNRGSTEYSAASGRDFRTNTSTYFGARQSQNWVITSMFAEPTYAVEATAGSLGNGCSPSPRSGAQVGPAANPTP
jgi:hypothetical protein